MNAAGNIKVVKPSTDFEQIPRKVIREYDVMTIGLYNKLLCLGENWNLNIKGLAAILNLSQDKVRKAVTTLEKDGYIVRHPLYKDNRLSGYKYTIYGNCVSEEERTRAGFAVCSLTENQPSLKPAIPENDQPINKRVKKNIKSNKEVESNNIDLPFSSPQFLDTWSILLKQPKWKKKSVDALRLAAKKLGKYSEQDAIQMMNNTIEGDWQGLFEIKTKTTTQTTISNGTNTKQSTNNRIHLGEMGFGTDTL